jgi:hypothetical protein
VKVRRHGTVEEVAEATRRLLEVADVVAVGGPSLDRGPRVLVRVDLKVRRFPARPAAPTRPTPPARRPRP